MKMICKALGGSHSYGLSTPTSDIDWRGVFINTDVKHLIGLSRHDHQLKQDSVADESYTEFRHSLNLLKQANTQTIELLYNENWDLITPEWQKIIDNREKLVDSTRLFNCLRGYMQGELRLANGERTGKLGGKRKETIDKYGFSPKNFIQLFRLGWAGTVYFQNGYFPVNVMSENAGYGRWLMDIKTNPIKYDKHDLNKLAVESEISLVKSFESRKIDRKFDEDLANQLCLEVYGPLIQDAYLKL